MNQSHVAMSNAATLQKRRAEARARSGHERVAVDAVTLRHLADASHRFLFTISNSPVSSLPARFASGFFSFLFTFVAATPD
jgi:hypothetical protein